MPTLLRELGISRWALAFELVPSSDGVRPALDRLRLGAELARLREAAAHHGISCFVNDEFDHFGSDRGSTGLGARKVFDPEFLYRFDPTGHVRVGSEMLSVWSSSRARRWDPRQGNAVEVTGYHASVARYWRRRKIVPADRNQDQSLLNR